jgi:hypothetical protein
MALLTHLDPGRFRHLKGAFQVDVEQTRVQPSGDVTGRHLPKAPSNCRCEECSVSPGGWT